MQCTIMFLFAAQVHKDVQIISVKRWSDTKSGLPSSSKLLRICDTLNKLHLVTEGKKICVTCR